MDNLFVTASILVTFLAALIGLFYAVKLILLVGRADSSKKKVFYFMFIGVFFAFLHALAHLIELLDNDQVLYLLGFEVKKPLESINFIFWTLAVVITYYYFRDNA